MRVRPVWLQAAPRRRAYHAARRGTVPRPILQKRVAMAIARFASSKNLLAMRMCGSCASLVSFEPARLSQTRLHKLVIPGLTTAVYVPDSHRYWVSRGEPAHVNEIEKDSLFEGTLAA